MSEAPLPVVVTCGERAVFHLLESSMPAGELTRALALYLGVALPAAAPFWRDAAGERALDPALPIGAQVPPDAEIELRPL